MNSRERVLTALNHKEPDRVPFDLGGTVVTGIHAKAYRRLRQYLGLPEKEIVITDIAQQIAQMDADVIDRLGVDVGSILPRPAASFELKVETTQDRRYQYFHDEFQIGWLTHFFHSCGSVVPIIPDLIEIGVDILNPVQVSAANMDSAELKLQYGNDICFWGGGVDTQKSFDENHSPAEVRLDVCKRLHDFMPGGGFVFATVHNIQGNVPPENILAMWETLQEYGAY